MSFAPFRVIVPASTSNLGSGFDTLSAALSLHLEVVVRPATRRGVRWTTPWKAGEENIVDTALHHVARELDFELPGMEVAMLSPIPLKRGLGSSGAAIIAGCKIAETICREAISDQSLLQLGYPLEGHPDNLAASLLGGWVLSRTNGDQVRAERIRSRLACRFVVVVPTITISTREAREILPESYPLADAVFNIQRCGLMVHALISGKESLLREAVQDKLHQPYRCPLIPGAEAILGRCQLPTALEDSLLATAISGSGSTILAMTTDREEEIAQWMGDSIRKAGTAATTRILELDTQGATVIELPD